MVKHCGNCIFNTEESCKIWKDKQVDCISWADEKERKARENAIKNYEIRKKYKKKTNIGTVRKVLLEGFAELYEKGFSDNEISDELKISQTSVGCYRRGLFLKTNIKKAV